MDRRPDDPRGSMKLRALLLPALMLVMGIVFTLSPRATLSEVENRALARWPALTGRALFKGLYTQGVDRYVADHLPLREALVSLSFLLREGWGFQIEEGSIYLMPEEGLEDFGGWIDMDDPDVEIDDGATAPLISAAAPGLKPTAKASKAPKGSKAPVKGTAKESTNEKKKEARRAKKVKEEMRKGVLVYGDRAIQLFGAKLALARAYAEVINGYRAVIHKDTRIFSIMVPTAVSFYLPDGHKYKRRSEEDYISEVYAHHDAGIISVDAYSKLNRHVDEFIYFRSDHHWTARGAYQAYEAFCEAALIKPVALSDMERKVKKHYIGSLYRYTKASIIRKNPEFVEYFKPKVSHKAVYYAWKSQDKAVKSSFIRERSGGYGVFLGADYPMLVAETSNKNGKTALLVKNSYGNPFAIYLLSHFEKVIVIDYRYTTKKILDLMRDHSVTDLIFLNVTLTAGSKFHRRKIEKIRGEGRYHPSK